MKSTVLNVVPLQAVKIDARRHYVVRDRPHVIGEAGIYHSEEMIPVAAIELRNDGNGPMDHYDVIYITDHDGEEIAIPAHQTHGWRIGRNG